MQDKPYYPKELTDRLKQESLEKWMDRVLWLMDMAITVVVWAAVVYAIFYVGSFGWHAAAR